MATKLQLITAMYDHALGEITGSAGKWQQFLHSASRNYKLAFEEQVLVHVQRPDASAVLEIEKWNRRFGRWVNRGATGIAVVDRDSPGKRRLRYYFDIADTHESQRSHPVPLWDMKPEYEADVIETLESTFGQLGAEDKETLPEAIYAAAMNAVTDNITDYLSDLMDCREDSFLEELDELNVEAFYRQALTISVTAMLMMRCGIEPAEYFDAEDFAVVHNFNTPATATLLGTATSAIAEMGLREIASTVLNLQRAERAEQRIEQTKRNIEQPEQNANRTVADRNESRDNDFTTIQPERGIENGRIDVQRGERLQNTRPEPAGGSRSTAWQIRPAAPQLPQTAPQGAVQPAFDERQAERAFAGSGANSEAAHGSDGVRDGGSAGRNGGTESQRPDGMGGQDEQHPPQRGRDDTVGTDTQLGLLPSSEEQQTNIEEAEELAQASTPSAFSVSQEDIDELLASGSGVQEGKQRIYEQFSKNFSTKENAAFLKQEYGWSGMGPAYGRGLGYESRPNGLTISHGYGIGNKAETTLKWPQVARRISELIALDRYLNLKEKEEYPKWLANEEAQRLQIAEERAAAEILRREPTPVDTTQYRYEYHLGDVAYIGSHEYEVLAFDDELVRLYDTQFPLVNAEIPRAEFDRKVAENPQNNHLRVEVAAEKASKPAETAETPPLAAKLFEETSPNGTERTDTYLFYHAGNGNEVAVLSHDTLKLIAEQADSYVICAEACYLSEAELNEYHISFRKMPRDWRMLPVAVQGKICDIKPEYEEQANEHLLVLLRAEMAQRGYEVSDELIAEGIYGFYSDGVSTDEDIEELGNYIEDDVLANEENLKQLLGTDDFDEPTDEALYLPKTGDQYEIQGRLYEVDTVSESAETVSLQDITFERGVGFPIFRTESLAFIRGYSPINTPVVEASEAINMPAWEQKPKPSRTDALGAASAYDAFPGIPLSERHNFRITDDNLGVGGAKAKFRANMDAIHLLHDLQLEERLASPQEQEILSRYVGWGALPQAFDADNAVWADEFLELQTTLGEQEYEAARASTLNAHYTSPVVIKAVYKAIANMGFKTGNILDPGCGVGNFQGLLPESMADSKVFGIELDPTTGQIARQLYQKNSIAIQGFEDTALPDSFFDLAIGNVPFGGYGVNDKRYDKHKFHIHDYFFAKTLDKVRPGGVVAFITSKYTMDKQNPTVRKYIAQRAELLGAIRLPNNAFLANAGTQVTTDIIFLQKRDRMVDVEPEWVHLGQLPVDSVESIGDSERAGDNHLISVNSYFVSHPEMILGTMSSEDGTRMYGNMNDTTCVPFEGAELADLLDEAVQNIHAQITEFERDEDEQEEDGSIPADPTVRNFSYALVNGKIYYRHDSRMIPVELPVTTQNRVKGLIELRECTRTLIEFQTENYPDSAIATEQSKLNRLYDSFTQKYGLINSRANSSAFSQDNAYCLLCSLEVLDENGELERKADIFTRRTIKPHIPVTHVDTASEALSVSMAEKAKVDLEYMAQLTGMSEEAIVKELEGVIFLNIASAEIQDKAYVTADEYLSGNVREKLELTKAAAATIPELAINVKALEAVMPKDLTAAEISVRLGATWLPKDIVQQFMYELLQTPPYAREKVRVQYSQYNGEWNISEKSYDRANIRSHTTYGTQRMNAYKIIEESLNLRDVRVWDKVYNEHGDEKRVINKKETAIAQGICCKGQ